MLIGWWTYEESRQDEGAKTEYPFSGPGSVLAHDPPDPAVTFLTGSTGEAAVTAPDAEGGKNPEDH